MQIIREKVRLSKQVAANAAASGGYGEEEAALSNSPVATGLSPVRSQRRRIAPWLQQRAQKQKRPVRFFQTGRFERKFSRITATDLEPSCSCSASLRCSPGQYQRRYMY